MPGRTTALTSPTVEAVILGAVPDGSSVANSRVKHKHFRNVVKQCQAGSAQRFAKPGETVSYVQTAWGLEGLRLLLVFAACLRHN
jgi:hypothetical protein